MFPRIIDLPLGRHSFFLFGPRQVGKTTLVRAALEGRQTLLVDLLLSEVLLKYTTRPHLLRAEVEFKLESGGDLLVFVDEIQRAPALLNEVHSLIENHKARVHFVLTGSSARKLKRASVNMLGGRAWELHLHPLTHLEMGAAFDLDRCLRLGSLPPVVTADPADAFQILRAYTSTYLKQEILDEALVRNVGAFSRFLELAADQSGAIVNYSTLARDTGISSKTIRAYYEVLEDTLVAFKLEPYLKSARKRLVRHPRHFLFDLGVVNAITGRAGSDPLRSPTLRGMLFEHFVVLEVRRLLSYRNPEARLFHWRSAQGAEVDLVVELGDRLIAVEIKTGIEVRGRDLSGLRSFCNDHPHAEPVCVSMVDLPYNVSEIPVLPWRELFGPKWLE